MHVQLENTLSVGRVSAPPVLLAPLLLLWARLHVQHAQRAATHNKVLQTVVHVLLASTLQATLQLASQYVQRVSTMHKKVLQTVVHVFLASTLQATLQLASQYVQRVSTVEPAHLHAPNVQLENSLSVWLVSAPPVLLAPSLLLWARLIVQHAKRATTRR
jgi:hypothetical protein